MAPTLVVMNPTSKARTRAKGRKTVAKKRTTRRRTTRTRTPTRRRRRSTGGKLTLQKFATESLSVGVGGTAGFVVAEMVPDRLPIDAAKVGWGRIAAKAATGILGGLAIAKFVGRKHGYAFASGAVVNAGASAYAMVRSGQLSGMGGMGGVGQIGYMPANALPMGGGVGDYWGDSIESELDGLGDGFDDEDF